MGFDCRINYKKQGEYLPDYEWTGQGRDWGRELLKNLPFEYNDSTYGQDVVLIRYQLEAILHWCCRNPPYGGNFHVDSLCEILYHYDELISQGYECVFEADW